jgi:pimeloyl-ACP methyl ester carboxylesterase
MVEELQCRIHGDAALTTLIYLPGLHGDWTLVGDFRRRVVGRVRFVEFTYPRTLTWSLDDYAAAIESALGKNGVTGGWLLGESYGSQVLWQLVVRKKFPANGLILAGGFVKHPTRWGVRLVQTLFGQLPLGGLQGLLRVYARVARIRYRHATETVANIQEFVVRRTEADRQAALHRLELIAGFDPRSVARETELPVFYLSGLVDPIVPWPLVRPWLRRQCPALREDRIILAADHNVLGTAPGAAAQQVLEWMQA